MTRYPAVSLDGKVYVSTHPRPDRVPFRHLDALTRAIATVAGSNAGDPDVAILIKRIDMGKVQTIFGDANADGSDFVALTIS